VAETPDKEAQGDGLPEAVPQAASTRVTATLVSLAALAIIGAATANSLPNSGSVSWPSFAHFSLPSFDHLSLSLPNFDRTLCT